MRHEIPPWIGSESVPETKDTTKELLECYAALIETDAPNIDIDMPDVEFLKSACDVGNKLREKHVEKYPDYTPSDVGIWVGFPETPIGKLNAQLVSMVWHLNDWLDQK